MEKISVIGAGSMGHTIALQAALSGFETVVFGMNATELQSCMKSIREAGDLLCEGAVREESEIKSAIAIIRTEADLSKAAGNATFVIECAPENISLKNDLFHQLEQHTSKDAILASTTSTFTPEMIMKNLRFPERGIITHFWNPAHLIPLVEVVRSESTSDMVFSRTMNILKKMNKHPVVLKKSIAGFIGNRLQLALFREAEYLLSNNICSIEDIDSVVTYGFGRRLAVMGPFMSADFTGLDVIKSITEQLYSSLSDADKSTNLLDDLAGKKTFGFKSGRGFYDNKDGVYQKKLVERSRELIRRLKEDNN